MKKHKSHHGHYESAEPMHGIDHAKHEEHKKHEKKKHHKKKEHEKHEKKHEPKKKHAKKGGKVEKVMHEFKEHKLHSGSKKGPMVSNRRQAVAIALSEARKAGAHIPKKKK